MPDPAVKLEVLAAVMAVSHDTVSRSWARGQLPAPDFRPSRRYVSWKLSTLRSWNPQIAAKIERGIQHEVFPFLIAT